MGVAEARETAEADERLLLRTGPSAAFAVPAPIAPNALAVPPDEAPARQVARRLGTIRLAVYQSLPRAGFETIRSLLREEVDRGAAFLWLPVAGGIGACLYFSLPQEPPFYALGLGLLVISAFCWLARGRHVTGLVLATGLSVVAGMTLAKLETLRTGTAMLGSSVTTHVTGRLVSMERDEKGRYRLVLDVVTTDRPHLRFSPDRIRALARSIPPGLRIGDGLSGYAHLRPQTGPVRPHGYDFAFRAYFDGIGASGFFLGTPRAAEIGPPGTGATLAAMVEQLRSGLTTRIRARVGGEAGAVAAALITGEKGAISETVNDAFRAAGLAHLLAISGLHMALVAGTIMGSLRAVFALFPGFAARRPTKKLAATGALLGISVYLLISGAGIATQRSFVMLGIMLLAALIDRAAVTMRNLAIAALVIVVIEPHEITGPSFQMSFAATAALIAAYGWWSKRKRVERGPSGHPVLQALRSGMGTLLAIAATSLIAGLATGIFAVFHFSRLAPLGIAANLVAVPVFTFLIMPLAILSVLAIPFELDAMPFHFMGKAIGLVISVAEKIAAVSPPEGLGPMPVSSLILLALALVVATLATTRLRLAALPLAGAGLFLFHQARPPDIVISENARLVGVRMAGAIMAINTTRPDSFSLDDWSRDYGTSYVVKPVRAEAPVSMTGTFTCSGDLCLAREDGGLDIAYASSSDSAAQACALGHIVILAYPARQAGCVEPGRMVITQRDLALKGALEIRLPPADTRTGGLSPPEPSRHADSPILNGSVASPPLPPTPTGPPDTRLALARLTFAASASLDRPWGGHRRYSKEARGIDPERHKRRPPALRPARMSASNTAG